MSQASAASDITDFVEWEQTLTTPQKRYHSLSRMKQRAVDRETSVDDPMDGLDGWGGGSSELELMEEEGCGCENEEEDDGGYLEDGANEEGLQGENMEAEQPEATQQTDTQNPEVARDARKTPKLVSAESWYREGHDPLALGGGGWDYIRLDSQILKGESKYTLEKKEAKKRRKGKKKVATQEIGKEEDSTLMGSKAPEGKDTPSKLTPDQKKEKKARKKAAQREKALEREKVKALVKDASEETAEEQMSKWKAAQLEKANAEAAGALDPRSISLEHEAVSITTASRELENTEQFDVEGQAKKERKLPSESNEEKKKPTRELKKKGPAASPFFEQQRVQKKAKNLKNITNMIADPEDKKIGSAQEETVMTGETLNAASMGDVAKTEKPAGRGRQGKKAKSETMRELKLKMEATTTIASGSSPVEASAETLPSQRPQLIIQDGKIVVTYETPNNTSVEGAKTEVPSSKGKRGDRGRKPKHTDQLDTVMKDANVKMKATTKIASISSPLDTSTVMLASERSQIAGFSLKRKRELEINSEFEDRNEPNSNIEPGRSKPEIPEEIATESSNHAKPKKRSKNGRRKRPRNKNKLQEIRHPVIYQLADLPDTNAQEPKNNRPGSSKKRKIDEGDDDASKAIHS